MSELEIPFSSPILGYRELKADLDEAFLRAADSGWYILGKEVREFEREFCHYLGMPYGVGVANGTDAVELALKAVGFSPGDIAITVAHTAVATISAIERAGGVPVLVDIQEESYCMDPEHLRETIRELDKKGLTPKVIIPVHIYGHPAPLQEIMEIAQSRGAFVVEDCAQAHGAVYRGKKVGSWGDASAFSFYPTKNLGALGDGGFVSTTSQPVYDRLVAIRQYGWTERYISTYVGVNSRLDEIQAAMLRVKLKRLEDDNQRRRALAALYRERLSGTDLILPTEQEGAEHVYHLYVARTVNRDRLIKLLSENSVGSAIHYPVPVHQQSAYSGRSLNLLPLPITEKVASEIVSLPMFPQLATMQIERVCEVILKKWT